MSLANKPTYPQEVSDWIQILDSMQQENVRLKTHIADVIKNDLQGLSLDQAELFLNNIINKEAVIALLRYDIAEYQRHPEKTKAEQIRVKLREDIRKMQGELKKLSIDFKGYVDTSLSA